MLDSYPFQCKMYHPADSKGNGKDDRRYPKGFFHTSLFNHHKELGDARDEEGDGYETDQDLVRIESSLFRHDEETCCSIVPSEKSDDEGLCYFGRKAQKMDDQRGGHSLQEDQDFCLVEAKEDDGSQDK